MATRSVDLWKQLYTPPNSARSAAKSPLVTYEYQNKHIELKERLFSEKGLRMIEISRNGNCLYLALSFVLTKTFPEMVYINNTFLSLYLRQKAVEAVVSNDSLFINGLIGASDLYTTPSQANIEAFENLTVPQKKHIYLKKASKYNDWAGQHEILELSRTILSNICIEVFTIGQVRAGE